MVQRDRCEEVRLAEREAEAAVGQSGFFAASRRRMPDHTMRSSAVRNLPVTLRADLPGMAAA
jgi:hypothetical protein